MMRTSVLLKWYGSKQAVIAWPMTRSKHSTPQLTHKTNGSVFLFYSRKCVYHLAPVLSCQRATVMQEGTAALLGCL